MGVDSRHARRHIRLLRGELDRTLVKASIFDGHSNVTAVTCSLRHPSMGQKLQT